MAGDQLELVRACAAAHLEAERLVTLYGAATAGILGRLRYSGCELSAFENSALVRARWLSRTDDATRRTLRARWTA